MTHLSKAVLTPLIPGSAEGFSELIEALPDLMPAPVSPATLLSAGSADCEYEHRQPTPGYHRAVNPASEFVAGVCFACARYAPGADPASWCVTITASPFRRLCRTEWQCQLVSDADELYARALVSSQSPPSNQDTSHYVIPFTAGIPDTTLLLEGRLARSALRFPRLAMQVPR